MDQAELFRLGLLLVLVGFFLIFLSAVKMVGDSKVRGEFAFVGFIGPVPIGFGTSKNTLIFATVIAVFMLMLFILLVRKLG